MAVRAVIFDLDGVVRHWDETPGRIEAELGLEPGSIGRALFEPVRAQAAVTGQISDREWRLAAARELVDQCNVDEGEIFRLLGGSAGHVDREVLAVVKNVRAAVPVGLLTNATSRLRDDLSALGIDDDFDAVVNSSEVGFAKPDLRIFEHACNALGAPPPEVIFFDDTEGHVRAAASMGVQANVFTGVKEMKRVLAEVGVAGT